MKWLGERIVYRRDQKDGERIIASRTLSLIRAQLTLMMQSASRGLNRLRADSG
jgi:hypothetical protein